MNKDPQIHPKEYKDELKQAEIALVEFIDKVLLEAIG
jgi:hypothetical protein